MTTAWPRAVLQCLFFTILGQVIGGEDGRAYAFVGSVAIIITLFTMVEICDVPMRDRWSATFYRLRTGNVPVAVLYLIRAWPMLAEAAAMTVLCIVLVGFATGQGDLALALLPLAPVYLLLVVTSAAAGLAATSVALFGRVGNDVIVGNLGMYVTIAASGAIIPPGRVEWLDAIGTLLPMRHGLKAIYAKLAGEPWLAPLLTEVAVGVGWLAIAVAVYTYATRRVKRTDHDKVT